MRNSGSERLECWLKVTKLVSGVAGMWNQHKMQETVPCSPHCSPSALPLRKKPQVGKGPGGHSPLLGEKQTLETRRGGQDRVLLRGRGDVTHPRPLGRGGGDSCIQLRLWKGHRGESSHCMPPRVGAGNLSPRTLCSAQAPCPSLRMSRSRPPSGGTGLG